MLPLLSSLRPVLAPPKIIVVGLAYRARGDVQSSAQVVFDLISERAENTSPNKRL